MVRYLIDFLPLSLNYLLFIDSYIHSPSRYSMSPTLHRDSFRYRYRYSPAADLSDKVINTLRRNLDSYVRQNLDDFMQKKNRSIVL
jgi:hypothetical protein